MSKKKIKIKIVDFYNNYVFENNFIYKLLHEEFDIEISENPDYLFYSAFGSEHLRYNNCIKIFYTGENLSPDFNLCDYAIGYDHMIFGDRYLRFPCYYNYEFEKSVEEMLKKHLMSESEIRSQKTEFCSFVYSNSLADSFREDFFELLSSYKKINSGGRFKNNLETEEFRPVADKLAFERKHKFSIAFENSSHDGYTTEKLVQAFAANTVPIYWGDPNVGEVFNKKAFIDCHDFKSTDDIIEYIKKIDEDENLYQNMINEPAVLNLQKAEFNYNLSLMKDFLMNIINKPIDKAARRATGMWPQRYFDQYY